MKASRTVFSIIGLIFLLFVSQPAGALAQEEAAPSPSFSKAQLTQMLAPIALYPDDVLSQILMASTYPIEVIEANRWLRDHQDLQGDSLDQALQDKDWDPSVKSLCHFPNVLTMMSDKIAETTNLGNAFLSQQDEVMDVVQELRSKAFEQGNLSSNQKEKVIVENQTIIIKPVNPEVIYIPYYNPTYVYGSWWYPDYPPYYWGPANVVGAGIYYWPTPFFGFGIGWSYFDWPSRYIVIDTHHRRPRFFRHDRMAGRTRQMAPPSPSPPGCCLPQYAYCQKIRPGAAIRAPLRPRHPRVSRTAAVTRPTSLVDQAAAIGPRGGNRQKIPPHTTSSTKGSAEDRSSESNPGESKTTTAAMGRSVPSSVVTRKQDDGAKRRQCLQQS